MSSSRSVSGANPQVASECSVVATAASTAQSKDFSIVRITHPEQLGKIALDSAITTYQKAFAGAPYFEQFSLEEVMSIFQEMANGDLIFGTLEGKTISLAGGYLSSDGQTYYIAELAVSPEEQKHGYGRRTWAELQKLADGRKPPKQEIRTSIAPENAHVIRLYETSGFSREKGTECVPHFRQDGTVSLDERIYLSKPPTTEQERLNLLKHVAVISIFEKTIAVVFDQLSEYGSLLEKRIQTTWEKKHDQRKKPSSSIDQCCFVTQPKQGSGAIARVATCDRLYSEPAIAAAIWAILKGANYVGSLETSGESSPLSFQVKEGRITLYGTCGVRTAEKVQELYNQEMQIA